MQVEGQLLAPLWPLNVTMGVFTKVTEGCTPGREGGREGGRDGVQVCVHNSLSFITIGCKHTLHTLLYCRVLLLLI